MYVSNEVTWVWAFRSNCFISAGLSSALIFALFLIALARTPNRKVEIVSASL
jgi:hypothetical protein